MPSVRLLLCALFALLERFLLRWLERDRLLLRVLRFACRSSDSRLNISACFCICLHSCLSC